MNFGEVKLSNRETHIGVDGLHYLVVHGDMFDGLMRADRKWIMHLGDNAYNLLLWINTKLNFVRRKLGLEYWSLSKSLNTRTKRAMNFIHSFEEQVADYYRRKDFDDAICGHIHVAGMLEIDGKWELMHYKPQHIRKKKPSKKQQLTEIPLGPILSKKSRRW